MITIRWIDPWTGEFLAGGTFVNTRQRHVLGYYRKTALGMKDIAKKWCAPRNPKLRIEIGGKG